MLRTKFNSDWEVLDARDSSLSAMYMNAGERHEVTLPHDAMIHEERSEDAISQGQSGFCPGGRYIYTKIIEVPEEWQDKTITLEFEGVYQTALVYVNGEFVTNNLYGYSDFYAVLDNYLRYGEKNEIKVIADNTAEPNSRWYTGSGIYRNVNLLIGGKIHIPADGVRITTRCADEDSAVIEIETDIKNMEYKKSRISVVSVIEKNGVEAGRERIPLTLYHGEGDTVHSRICLEKPKLWNTDTPELYDCVIYLEQNGEVLDKWEGHFGIRTVTVDAVNGLRINGKTVKLRGTCIHHDNGIIGAATLERAEERRCRQLKEAGFNSIRSSHHPVSKAMLDACDREGILVMDELSDIWQCHKNPHDFATFFHDCWEQEVTRMVAKDYNHPSVILYSTGNEIPEIGMDCGARMNRKLCSKFRELDPGRYTTAGISGMLALSFRGNLNETVNEVVKEMRGEEANGTAQDCGIDDVNALNNLMSVMDGEGAELFSRHPFLTEAIEESEMSLDVIGLNYLTGRHILENKLHPNKPLIGAETYPADIVRLWKLVKEYPHILGDFTWTGYDYLGEAGCGIFHYDGGRNFSDIYPERIAYIGDINLIGYRRPISYFREIVFGLRKQPYLAVERVNRYGMEPSKTAWMFKDNVASWTWTGLEGKPARADIYADAEEVELFLNGRSLGKKPAGEAQDFKATYELIYEPGELTAVSYDQGVETGRFSLATAGENIFLQADADRTILKADGSDLAFITVKLVDENGTENLFATKEITVSVEGPVSLQGFGSADPQSTRSYDDTTWETYDGYVMAVVRTGRTAGTARVKFTAPGCPDVCVDLEIVGETE